MNCSNYRDQLAALTLGALEPADKHAVELHLSTCAACRATLAELKSVTQSLEGVQTRNDIQTSERFHRAWTAQLHKASVPSFRERAAAFLKAFRLSPYHYALPIATVALLILIGAFWLWSIHAPNEVRSTTNPRNLSSRQPSADSEIEPTLSNYQVVANRSFEKLDQLLNTQGTKTAPSSLPVYTASALSISKDLE